MAAIPGDHIIAKTRGIDSPYVKKRTKRPVLSTTKTSRNVSTSRRIPSLVFISRVAVLDTAYPGATFAIDLEHGVYTTTT
jgi:hypothetical protein